MQLPVINAIWIGPRMGPTHAACLRSFLRTGHRVVLHSYDEVADAPEGVERADADAIFPRSQVQRHRASGSYSTAANLIRYEILARGLGLYVDCDVFCLRPMPAARMVFGWENDNTINNAVLQLPPGPLLEAMRGTGRRGWYPPWGSPMRQVLRKLHAPYRSIYHRRFGTSGPRALTWYAKELGLADRALPPDVFYPVAFDRVHLLTDPGLSLDDVVTSRTHYVHLYNHSLGDPRPPRGSILHRILES